MASQLDLQIAVAASFDLCQAVCSYGFFIQAPNVWDHKNRCLSRPLVSLEGKILPVTITETVNTDRSGSQVLQVQVLGVAEHSDIKHVESQVRRMLRLSQGEQQHVLRYHKLDEKAQQEGFGALFRSPTVWEDLVKSILLCNCGWGRTLAMNKALCSKIGCNAFPSPKDIVEAGLIRLQTECGLGYRAKPLLQLGQQIVSGEVDLEQLDESSMAEEEVYAFLLGLPGVGPFTAANMLQLLGHYKRIPCDSETVRHLRKAHGLHTCTQANVQHHADKTYAKYAPYQFLAYWRELWRDYEQLVGPFHLLSCDAYHLLTGHNMRKGSIPGRGVALDDAQPCRVDKNGSSSQSGSPVQPLALPGVQTRAQTRSQAHAEAAIPTQKQLRSAPQQAQHAQQHSDSCASAREQHHVQAPHNRVQHAAVASVSEGLQTLPDKLTCTQAEPSCCPASKPATAVSPLQQLACKRKHMQPAVSQVETDQSAVSQSGSTIAGGDVSSAAAGKVKSIAHNKRAKAAKVQTSARGTEPKPSDRCHPESRLKK